MTQTHESHPPKSALERLISALSMHGVDPDRIGGTGAIKLTPGDWAGALSGSGDVIGEATVWVRYLDSNPDPLARMLHRWGWNALAEKRSRIKMSAREHEQLAVIAVEQHACHERVNREQAMERLGIGRSRYDAIKPHHVSLVTRMVNGESRALEHLRRMVR